MHNIEEVVAELEAQAQLLGLPNQEIAFFYNGDLCEEAFRWELHVGCPSQSVLLGEVPGVINAHAPTFTLALALVRKKMRRLGRTQQRPANTH